MLIVYYVAIAGLVCLFNRRKIRFLRFILGDGWSRFCKENGRKMLAFSMTGIILFSVARTIPGDLRIYFVDVGSGDCCVIKSPMGKNIIIDGGNNRDYDYGENVVVPYLLDRKMTKVDFLMVSHFDADHCGGLFAVLENLKVDTIVIGKQGEAYDNCTEFLELTKNKHVKVISVQAGDILKIDKRTSFQILWPDAKNMISDNGINNNSMMGKLVYGDFSMLFTGDIEEKAEKVILEKYKNTDVLDCDILKVAHHGSKSSSMEEFVEMVSPQVSVIGVGDNKYGHPNMDVIKRLEGLRK